MTNKRRPRSTVIEEHGIKVRIFSRGGTIYRDVTVGRTKSASGKVRTQHDIKSLQTDRWDVAEERVRALCAELVKTRLPDYVAPGTLTLAQLRATYLHERRDVMSESRKAHIRKSFALLERHLGAAFPVADLSEHQAETYAAARMSGALVSTNGRHIRQKVRAATVSKELACLHAALNWAAKVRRNGKPLVPGNPLRGVPLPSDPVKLRPVATRERYEKMLAQADGIDGTGRFRMMLTVAWHTGRRLGSIVALRVSDLHLTPEHVQRALAGAGMDENSARHWPAAITWAAEADKESVTWIVPIPESLRAALAEYVRKRGVVGNALLFPAARKPEEPVSKETTHYWYKRAEKLAGLPRQARGGWHSLRRAWATARKHMPLQDVMAAGGWRDPTALQAAYQHADPRTVRAVMDLGA